MGYSQSNYGNYGNPYNSDMGSNYGIGQGNDDWGGQQGYGNQQQNSGRRRGVSNDYQQQGWGGNQDYRERGSRQRDEDYGW